MTLSKTDIVKPLKKFLLSSQEDDVTYIKNKMFASMHAHPHQCTYFVYIM